MRNASFRNGIFRRPRWILFLSLTNFYVTAERNFNPELKKRAIVVARGSEIVDISPEARQEGVHSGISLGHLRSIPKVQILSHNEENYLPFYHRVWGLVTDYATKVEPIDFHVGFVQFVQNIDPEEALRLKEELLKSAKLESRIGGGPNKLIARLSARWEMLIPEDEVDHFLLSVPVGDLNWVDYRVIKRLNRLGVSTIGEIKAIPEGLLKKEFPKHAALLNRIGRGVDLEPVISNYPPEREEKVLELEGEGDYRVLLNYLSLCAKELSRNLRFQKREAFELELVLSEGREERRRKKKLICPVSSHQEISRLASQLLREIWGGGEIYTIKIILSELKIQTEEMRGISKNFFGLHVCENGGQFDFLHTVGQSKPFKEFRGEELFERIKRRYGDSVIGFKKGRRRMAELIFERRGKYLL